MIMYIHRGSPYREPIHALYSIAFLQLAGRLARARGSRHTLALNCLLRASAAAPRMVHHAPQACLCVLHSSSCYCRVMSMRDKGTATAYVTYYCANAA
eukprot:4543632-Prymnesium_polylepis.1